MFTKSEISERIANSYDLDQEDIDQIKAMLMLTDDNDLNKAFMKATKDCASLQRFGNEYEIVIIQVRPRINNNHNSVYKEMSRE